MITWLVALVVRLLRWRRPLLAPLPPTQAVSERWLLDHVYTHGQSGDR